MNVPHESAVFLKNTGFLPHDANNPRKLQDHDISKLTKALQKDAAGYLYNGVLSIGTGIKSLSQKNYGWATVKFYYSVFYLARAKLAINDCCFLYEKTKPLILLLKPQAGLETSLGYLKKSVKGTHKLTLALFQHEFSSDVLLSSGIGGQFPPDWLIEQREVMNYNTAAMPDPKPPDQYTEIAKKQVRQWLNLYLEDFKNKKFYYTFDPEHACLAYPINLLLNVLTEFKDKKIPCSYLCENSSFIKNLFSDSLGTFSALMEKMENF